MSRARAPAEPPELSVVILCYREEDYVRECHAAVAAEIERLGVPYEIVLVANYVPGSADRTPRVAAEVAEKHERVTVVAKPKAGMMGWDMRTGLDATTGRVLAVIDGDGQTAPADILRAYRALRERGLDLCQGYRVTRQDGWKRRLVSRVYNGIFALLFPGTGLHDVNAKPKVMTRAAYESLRLTSDDWFIDAEIVIQARRHRLRLGEIRSAFGKGRGRPSYVKATAVLEFVKNLVRFRLAERARRRAGRREEA